MPLVAPSYQAYKSAFSGQRMPFAFVDLDLFDANVRSIAQMAMGKNIRIASKSVRVPQLLSRILSQGSPYQGIMCYSAREADYLATEGFDDLLMGYPCWHPADVEPLLKHIQAGKLIRLMVDSVAHIQHLDALGAKAGVKIPVCLDMDMSSDLPGLHFGVWRSSVFTVDDAVKVARAALACKHVKLDAVMGYEAQIAGLGDHVAGQTIMNSIVRLLKRWSIKQLTQRRADIVSALTQEGIKLAVVNGGGTGSMNTTCTEACVTEGTVGSGFFAPTLFDNYGHFQLAPAAGYAVEVVRHPKPNIYTCLGGGYVASGEVGKLKQPSVYLPEGATLLAQEGVGEVQTPINYAGKLDMGSPVFLRHAKAGELFEHFNEALLLRNNKVIGSTPTYRGLGKKML